MRLATAALAVVACAGPWTPLAPTPYEPPDIYREWWSEITCCSGLRGDFNRIRWYVAPSDQPDRFDCPDGPCGGWWVSDHRIYLAPGLVYDKWIVQHEMLHDLIGVGGHPPVFERCGVR